MLAWELKCSLSGDRWDFQVNMGSLRARLLPQRTNAQTRARARARMRRSTKTKTRKTQSKYVTLHKQHHDNNKDNTVKQQFDGPARRRGAHGGRRGGAARRGAFPFTLGRMAIQPLEILEDKGERPRRGRGKSCTQAPSTGTSRTRRRSRALGPRLHMFAGRAGRAASTALCFFCTSRDVF